VHWNADQPIDSLFLAQYLTTFLPWVKNFIGSAVLLVVLRECSAVGRCCAILQQSMREIHRGDFPGDFWWATQFANVVVALTARIVTR